MKTDQELRADVLAELERELVEDAVRHAAGVTEVVDNLAVGDG